MLASNQYDCIHIHMHTQYALNMYVNLEIGQTNTVCVQYFYLNAVKCVRRFKVTVFLMQIKKKWHTILTNSSLGMHIIM